MKLKTKPLMTQKKWDDFCKKRRDDSKRESKDRANKR